MQRPPMKMLAACGAMPSSSKHWPIRSTSSTTTIGFGAGGSFDLAGFDVNAVNAKLQAIR